MIYLSIPKGSIGPNVESLMQKAGLRIKWQAYNGYVDSPYISKVIKLRPQDSPLYVARGLVDACITGEDCIRERGLEDTLIKVVELPITKAKRGIVSHVLFVRENSPVKTVRDIPKNGIIATEYPNIACQYLQENHILVQSDDTSGLQFDILVGTTETPVAAGFVNAGIDIVDTGNTLKANGLRIVDVVMQSSTVLAANQQTWTNTEKRKCLRYIAQLLLKALNEKRKETVDKSKPDFEKRNGLITVIVQDFKSKVVLMHAYMNDLAWQKTLATGRLYLWSTSHDKLWPKGEESGNRMVVKEVYLDCDNDCTLILVEVEGKGNACHTGSKTCFFNKVK